MAEWKVDQASAPDWFETVDEPFQLFFGDPPFNIGVKYQDGNDRLSLANYYDLTAGWIEGAFDALRPGGVLCIHGSPRVHLVVSQALVANGLDEFWETEVVWFYGFGQHRDTSWIDSHCRCVILRKPGTNRSFHADNVRVKSVRLKMGDVPKKSGSGNRKKDSRVEQSANKGWVVPGTVWGSPHDTEFWRSFWGQYIDKDGCAVPGSVWGTAVDGDYWGRVQGNDEERRKKHQNQLRELYLARLIRAYTSPGDLVGDCFTGSGTTPTVAVELGRRFAGCEQSAEYVESIRERVEMGCVRDVNWKCGPYQGSGNA